MGCCGGEDRLVVSSHDDGRAGGSGRGGDRGGARDRGVIVIRANVPHRHLSHKRTNKRERERCHYTPTLIHDNSSASVRLSVTSRNSNIKREYYRRYIHSLLPSNKNTFNFLKKKKHNIRFC